MSFFPIRSLTALSLASAHLAVSCGSLVAIGSAASAQTPPPPPTKLANPPLPTTFSNPPLTAPRRPTALELVESARQQLINRGELPASSAVGAPIGEPGPIGAPIGPTPINTLPAPPPPFAVYRLGPGDVVSVYVQRFTEFNFQAAVDPEGQITHPLLGKIVMLGLTVEQAQARVRERVDRYIINPVVLLSLSSQRPVQVTVSGQIARPGLYPLQPQSPRVSSVLLAAGGTLEQADLRAIKIRRTLPDGAKLEETVDLFTPLRDGGALPDTRLQDGDALIITKLDPQDTTYDRTLISRSTLVKPKIIVRILSYARGGLGQVSLDNGSTFLDALATSGATPDNANFQKIALVRFDPKLGKAVTLQLDGKKALMGDPTQNLALQDNDVIVIGRNLVGKITYALNVFTQPFRDVLGFLLFFKQLGSSATNLFAPNGSNNGN
jgi:polysaccharide biosynthesis/export protein